METIAVRYFGGATLVGGLDALQRPPVRSLVSGLLLTERRLHLLLDVVIVLAEGLFFRLGKQPEGDPDHAVREFHVEPVLAELRATGDVEIQLADTRPVVADIGLIPGHRPGAEVREK